LAPRRGVGQGLATDARPRRAGHDRPLARRGGLQRDLPRLVPPRAGHPRDQERDRGRNAEGVLSGPRARQALLFLAGSPGPDEARSCLVSGLGVLGSGMVCAVGTTAERAAAAIRAGISGLRETSFVFQGQRLVGGVVPITPPTRGLPKILLFLGAA